MAGLRDLVRTIPDYPKTGIMFRDITTLLRDPAGFRKAVDEMVRKAVAAGGSHALDPQDHRDDLLHYSVLPWISFTSFSHARRHRADDSVPKIVFGRYRGDAGAERMPVSVEVHHALVDGLHVGRFLDRMQARLNAFG